MTSTPAASRQLWLRERTWVETAFPLLAAYFAFAVLFAWQAWRREVPTIFGDELEMTQLSRSIADTGLPARRGDGHGFTTLVPWLTAPAWWIGDTETAYATIKYLQGLVMASAIFPAYLLARTVVSQPWALFAAVATIAAPALSYAPILVEEPFAYPAATLALWLLARAAARLTWPSVVLAAVACLLAMAIRSQLIALGGVLVVVIVVHAWRGATMRSWRVTWSRWDWTGAVALGVGALLLVMAFIGHRSAEWSVTMALWKGRIVDYGVWAAGAFAIGVGIVPVVAALTVLARPPGERREPRVLAWLLVSGSALFFVGFYAGVKGAYVSTVFGSYVVERNLIYLAPVVFVSTALLLERRSPRWWAAAAATAFVLYLVVDTPMRLDQYPYYEAHGLAILAFANRVLAWPEATIQATLIAVAVGAGGALAAFGFLRGRRAATTLALSLAALVLGWNLLNEIYAANGERRLSDRVAANLIEPRAWVDAAVGDATVTMVGQQFVDNTGVNLAEFFNRSIVQVWSADPSSGAPPPGRGVTLDLAAPDGTMAPEPGTGYALGVNGIRLQGDLVEERADGRLYRLDGPIRLAENRTGVYSDGWMGRQAAYNRFDVSRDGTGFARVQLSRVAFCTDETVPSRMVIKLGPIDIGADKQASLGRTTETRTLTLLPCKAQTVLLRPPPGPWRVEITADTFVPAQLDPNLSDSRELGARVEFGFVSI